MEIEEKKKMGYVPIYKHIKNSEVWEYSIIARDMWIWFLIEAHHPERPEYDGKYTIKTGQLLASYAQIAKALRVRKGRGFSVPNTRTLERTIEWMKERTMVGTMVVPEGMIITILNYETWNDNENNGWDDSGDDWEYIESYNGSEHSYTLSALTLKEEPSKSSKRDDEKIFNHPENLSLSDSKDLKLDTTKPVDRWINAFHNHRPTAGHPFRNLPQPDIQDVKQRVQDFIDWQGEEKAIALLKEIFSNPQKPSSVKQAILFCNKIAEKNEAEKTKSPSFSNKCPECGHFGIMENLRNPTPQTQGVAPKWFGIKHFVCSKCNYRLKATEEMIQERKKSRGLENPKEREEAVPWLNP